MYPIFYFKEHRFRKLFDPNYEAEHREFVRSCETRYEKLSHEYSDTYFRYICLPSMLGINAGAALNKHPLPLVVIPLVPFIMVVMFGIQFQIDKHKIYRKAMK
jgi:hypothetical protein